MTALGFVAISACDTTSACGPGNCNGCCTAEGVCEIGTAPLACGANGGACVLCGPNDSCTLGTCIPPPSSGGRRDAGTTDAGGGADGGQDGGVTLDAGADGGLSDAGADAGADAGTDAGTDGGVVPTMTITQLRQSGAFGSRVRLENVVVRDVSYVVQGTSGEYRAEFWVVDPSNAKAGLWVDKFYTDTPGTYLPQKGDWISIDGWYVRMPAHFDRTGYRPVMRNEFTLDGGTGKLGIVVKGTMGEPPPPTVNAGSFGNAGGGSVQANPDYAGARVHINGPLTLVNAQPTAMGRTSVGMLVGYNGFEVTGGILVNNYRTFSGCDYRTMAESGSLVTFPNGISGVWDTYTHAPCTDTASPCYRDIGSVPGTANDYTFVLYPQDCTTDLPGVVQ